MSSTSSDGQAVVAGMIPRVRFLGSGLVSGWFLAFFGGVGGEIKRVEGLCQNCLGMEEVERQAWESFDDELKC